jgi:hypothetical protein
LETILNLPLKKRTASIVWEHVIKTVAGAVVAWGVIIFGPPLFLGRTRASRHHHDGDLLVAYYELLTAEPWIPITIVILSSLVYNMIVYFQNSRSVHVTSIQYNNETKIFSFSTISHYSNRSTVHTVPQEELKIIVKKSKWFGDAKTVIFKNGKKDFGFIYSSHEIWSSNRQLIMPTLHKIHDILYPDIPFKGSEILSALISPGNKFNVPLDFFRNKPSESKYPVKHIVSENGVEIPIRTIKLFDFKKSFLVITKTEMRWEKRGKKTSSNQWCMPFEKIKEIVVAKGTTENSNYTKFIFYDAGFRSFTHTIHCHLKEHEKSSIESWMKYVGLKISFLEDKHRSIPLA